MAELRVKSTGTLKLFESDNTSSVTIASPASLGADRTITLPDGDVTLVAGTMSTGGGITAASQWRLTTTATGDLEPIASNWEVNDTTGYGSLGSAMSESSGVFTFPSTGFWLITFICTWYYSGDSRWVEADIRTTTNNSSYTNPSETYSFIQQTSSGVTYATATAQTIFDVTDTAQCKVQFRSRVDNDSTSTYGSSSANATGVTFIRLGDT